MIRAQRTFHRRLWWVLGPALVALVIWAAVRSDQAGDQAPPEALAGP